VHLALHGCNANGKWRHSPTHSSPGTSPPWNELVSQPEEYRRSLGLQLRALGSTYGPGSQSGTRVNIRAYKPSLLLFPLQL
jgi:hypothetical protein